MFTAVQSRYVFPPGLIGFNGQAMALCTVCKGIPTNFFALFTPLTPNFSGISDRSLFHYEHHTPSALRQSAANGCPMCKILECQLNDHWLSRESKDKERLTMKREMFDPEAFGLWMGDDEISHSFYYLMSPKYRRLSYCHVIST